jgi:hypothetical protein
MVCYSEINKRVTAKVSGVKLLQRTVLVTSLSPVYGILGWRLKIGDVSLHVIPILSFK